MEFPAPYFIKPETTPEQFEEWRANYRENDLSFGCGIHAENSLSAAAKQGNIRLIQHIVTTGGKQLLDLGEKTGLTPLNAAVLADQYKAAEALIQLGARVNLATAFMGTLQKRLGKFRAEWIHFPQGATPLWSAIHRARNVTLITLLLRNGALMQECDDGWITPEMKERYEQAQMEIEDQTSQLLTGLPSFPEAVATLVDEYASALKGQFEYPKIEKAQPNSDEEFNPPIFA